MLTRNEIIEQLYRGKNFCDCISRMEPAHLRDDLKQEIAVIICQWTDDKVVNLHQEGALEYYVVRVIINQIQSSSSEFFRKYRKQFFECYIGDDVGFDDLGKGNNTALRHHVNVTRNANRMQAEEPDMKERLIREELEDFTIEQINNLYWYDRDLMKLYLRVGTFRAMQAETTIPFISCYKNIQKSLEVLRQKALAPKSVFTKSELKYIQNGDPKTD